jgi:1-acyl-sn-glycerol-3-phosphate acyltransferase
MSDVSTASTAKSVYPYPANPKRVRVTRWMMRRLADILLMYTTLKVKVSGLEYVPTTGSTIVVFNHVTLFDPAVVGLVIKNRDAVPLTKIELSKSLATSWMIWGWNCIPVQRGEVDRTALRRALELLKTEDMLLISPEGHRNKDGLRNPKEGTALLANQGNAIILPVGVSGTEHVMSNLKRFRRTPVVANIGRPFRLKSTVNRKLYQQATDEIMYQIATLTTPELRGEYADLSKVTTETIEFV